MHTSPDTTTDVITVYIPTSGIHVIDPRSGVASSAEAVDGRLLVDYESNRYGAANITTYADRVYHAASRHTTRYPTVARSVILASDLVAIGTFDAEYGRISLYGPEAEQLLATWLGVDHVDPAELEATGGHFEMKRAVDAWNASPDPVLRAQAAIYERTMGRR